MAHHKALSSIDQIIAALTYDEVERHPTGGGQITRNRQIPLLHRSISQDLIQIERGIGAKGKTLLSALAASIDEALLAAEQARKDVLKTDSSSDTFPDDAEPLNAPESPDEEGLDEAPRSPDEGEAAIATKKPAPPQPFEQRQARFKAAEAFLKMKAILVTPVNRDAQIRTYRVSGKRDSMIHEEVVEYAISLGMAE